MNPTLPAEVEAFASTAAHAFAGLGGVDAARRAEVDPTRREADIAPVVRALGADDLANGARDGDGDADALAAAAVLCEEGGKVALPYPLASVLCADDGGRPFAVVGDGPRRVDHGDLFPAWVVAPLSGPAVVAAPTAPALGTRLGPFVTALDDGTTAEGRATHGGTDAAVARHLTLTAFQILGTAARAVEQAVDHVRNRVQFGHPLATFQSVQFQLADCAVAVAGLRELGHFTVWRVARDPGAARPDALALRAHALEVARSVLRTAQQLHGAAGMCEEYDISLLVRMIQPALRLPWGAERTWAEATTAIRRDGFEGLFPHGADELRTTP